MFGPYVHRIDPIWASVGGVHFWWYGFPARYGRRHPGLHHSRMYPPIDTAAYRPTVRQ